MSFLKSKLAVRVTVGYWILTFAIVAGSLACQSFVNGCGFLALIALFPWGESILWHKILPPDLHNNFFVILIFVVALNSFFIYFLIWGFQKFCGEKER